VQRPARNCGIGDGSVNLSKVACGECSAGFPQFDAAGVANKARSKIAITLVRPCNSEIALNGPFSAHAEIHTDTRQLPAKPSRRRDIAYRGIVRNCHCALKGEKSIFRDKIQCGKLTAIKSGSNFPIANWIEAEQRGWPAMTAFECIADEICSN
jgi:hypothetical protein